MLVDEVSRRHLELVVSSDGTRRGSLLSVLDETLTPVGARTLANWIVYPLLDLDAIRARHDAVEELFEADLGGTWRTRCGGSAISSGWRDESAACARRPRDCLQLEQALRAVGGLSAALGALPEPAHPRGRGPDASRCPSSPRISTRRSATSRRSIRATAT